MSLCVEIALNDKALFHCMGKCHVLKLLLWIACEPQSMSWPRISVRQNGNYCKAFNHLQIFSGLMKLFPVIQL